MSRESDRSLSRFIIYVLYPCFIIYHVLGTESKVGIQEAWMASVFGFFAISIGFLVALPVVSICRIEKKENPLLFLLRYF